MGWELLKEAVRHHKWMNTPVIGKLKMPRETKKAVQKLSDSLITQEQIEQAVRKMNDAYSKPPMDHYVLIYSQKVVEIAMKQPDFEPLHTYIRKIDKPYNGEVGRLRVLGRLCRIIQSESLGMNAAYVMRDDTLMYPDYRRGGRIE